MTVVGERTRSGLGPTRAAVLDFLRQATTPQSVTAVAAAVALHPNTARFHLDALADQQLALRDYEKRSRPGRPKLLYSAEPEPPGVQDLAGVLVRHLDRLGSGDDDQAEAAGRFWGEELAAAEPGREPLDRVVAALDRLGYQPSVPAEPADAIVLTPCPLASLVTEPPEPGRLPAVCRLHLGLIRGLLGDDPARTVDALEPWATPTTCLVRLGTRGDG